jgi:hypothetical protein
MIAGPRCFQHPGCDILATSHFILLEMGKSEDTKPVSGFGRGKSAVSEGIS